MPEGTKGRLRASEDIADTATKRERTKQTHERIKLAVRRSFNKNVLSESDAFAGAFALNCERFPDPVLVSATASAGSKLQLAAELGLHVSLGGDLVNHCVNDVAIQGATPLFFQDYFAAGQLDPPLVAQVVSGMVEACKANGCALLGGETSESPMLHHGKHYDAAGFLVGVASREKLLSSAAIVEGDALLALPSNGLHGSGLDLARMFLLDAAGYRAEQYVNELGDKVGALLMRPHRSYLAPVRKLVQTGHVHGFAHITGGGLTESLPRMLPRGLAAQVNLESWAPGPLFTHLQQIGGIEPDAMGQIFNLGVGLVAAVAPAQLKQVQTMLSRMGERSMLIGKTVRSIQRKVIYC